MIRKKEKIIIIIIITIIIIPGQRDRALRGMKLGLGCIPLPSVGAKDKKNNKPASQTLPSLIEDHSNIE